MSFSFFWAPIVVAFYVCEIIRRWKWTRRLGSGTLEWLFRSAFLALHDIALWSRWAHEDDLSNNTTTQNNIPGVGVVCAGGGDADGRHLWGPGGPTRFSIATTQLCQTRSWLVNSIRGGHMCCLSTSWRPIIVVGYGTVDDDDHVGVGWCWWWRRF